MTSKDEDFELSHEPTDLPSSAVSKTALAQLFGDLSDDSEEEDSSFVADSNASDDDDGSGTDPKSEGGEEDSESDDEDSEEQSSNESVEPEFVGLPIRGYVFPGAHKLVASGDAEGLQRYLTEMMERGGLLDSDAPAPWEQRDLLGRLPIHLALVQGGRLDVVRVLVSFDAQRVAARQARMKKIAEDSGMEISGEDFVKYSTLLKRFDEFPCAVLALAHAPWGEGEESIEFFEMLADHPAGKEALSMLDPCGRGVLHVAAMAGKSEIVYYLSERHPELFKHQFTLKDATSQGGWPVHAAIDGKHAGLVRWFFDVAGPATFLAMAEDQLTPENHPFMHCVRKCAWECMHAILVSISDLEWSLPQTAIDLAEQLGVYWELATICLAEDVSVGLAQVHARNGAAAPSQTAVLYDEDCLGHLRLADETCDGGHFRLKRINAIPENPTRLEVLVGGRGALDTEEFARPHSSLRHIKQVRPAALADVLRVHEWGYIRQLEMASSNILEGQLVTLDTGDTKVSGESWLAALKAANCVVQAVDLVVSGTCKNAFAAVRPPGHHVGMRGAVDRELEDSDKASQGFCLLNNVAIGAAYALNVHRHSIGRVAIIDFDVHHGNGTEALVRGLAGPKTKVFPIMGGAVTGFLEQHSFCPWLDPLTDKDNVFFASIHRFDGKFYPFSGATSVENTVVDVGFPSGATSEDLRDAFMRVILPKLLAFAPDMIFISAGFDGHKRDRLAAGECDFDEHDYYWMTEQLLAVAREGGHSRVVSVLEGGYNTRAGWLSPLSQAVTAHVRALLGSHASKTSALRDNPVSSPHLLAPHPTDAESTSRWPGVEASGVANFSQDRIGAKRRRDSSSDEEDA